MWGQKQRKAVIRSDDTSIKGIENLIKIQKFAFIQIIHKTKNLKGYLKKFTSQVQIHQTRWNQSFYFDSVNRLDIFEFILYSEHYEVMGTKQVHILQMKDFIDTGELISLILQLQKGSKVRAQLFVSFQLFERTDPMAGVSLPNLSLNELNLDWDLQQISEAPLEEKTSKSIIWSCLEGDCFQGRTDIQLIPDRFRRKRR